MVKESVKAIKPLQGPMSWWKTLALVVVRYGISTSGEIGLRLKASSLKRKDMTFLWRLGSSCLKERLKRINSSLALDVRLRWRLMKVDDFMILQKVIQEHLNRNKDFTGSIRIIYITRSSGNSFMIPSTIFGSLHCEVPCLFKAISMR